LGLARAGVRIVIDYIAHPEATDELEKQISALHDQAIGPSMPTPAAPTTGLPQDWGSGGVRHRLRMNR